MRRSPVCLVKLSLVVTSVQQGEQCISRAFVLAGENRKAHSHVTTRCCCGASAKREWVRKKEMQQICSLSFSFLSLCLSLSLSLSGTGMSIESRIFSEPNLVPPVFPDFKECFLLLSLCIHLALLLLLSPECCLNYT